MSDPFRLLPVEPIGTRARGPGLVCGPGGGYRDRLPDETVYPPNPHGEAHRKLRQEIGLSLAQVAGPLGMSAHELSRLESGKATLESAAEWERLLEALRAREPARNTRIPWART